jgi:hypothetical protein
MSIKRRQGVSASQQGLFYYHTDRFAGVLGLQVTSGFFEKSDRRPLKDLRD